MTSLPFVKNPLKYEKLKLTSMLKSASNSCNTNDKTCTDSTSTDFIKYDPSSDSPSNSDEESYYSRLQNVVYGTNTFEYKFGDGIFAVGAPSTDYVSGALNVHFEMYEEKGRSIPNYMKYILSDKTQISKGQSPPYTGTIFELVYKLMKSESFLTPFEITTTSKTDTRVLQQDLSNYYNMKLDDDKNGKVYVRGVNGRRDYGYNVSNTTSTYVNPYTVFSIILEQFNKLIDNVIKYNWTYDDLSDVEDKISSSSSSSIIGTGSKSNTNVKISNLAMKTILETFFKVQKASDNSTTTYLPYSQFIYTLLLPSILYHLEKNYDPNFDSNNSKTFYYMGYIPAGSKCIQDNDTHGYDEIGLITSVEPIRNDNDTDNINNWAPSIYSSTDNSEFSESLNTSSSNTAQWFSLGYGTNGSYTDGSYGNDGNDGSDITKSVTTVVENDNDLGLQYSSSNYGSENKSSTNRKTFSFDIYSFPSDMNIYRYILYQYAPYIIKEIEYVIVKMNYYPVMLKRCYDVCLSNTTAFGTTEFDLVEPIIGFPIYKSPLTGDYIITGCSAPISNDSNNGGDSGGHDKINMNYKLNNVIRNISLSSTSTNLLTKYANQMIKNGAGHYGYLALPTELFDIENNYTTQASIDSSAESIQGVTDGDILYFGDNNDFGEYSSNSNSSNSEYSEYEKWHSSIGNNHILFTTDEVKEYKTYENINEYNNSQASLSRNTVRVAYLTSNVDYKEPSKNNDTFEAVKFIYNSYDVVQYAKKPISNASTSYQIHYLKYANESETKYLVPKMLMCQYVSPITQFPSILKNSDRNNSCNT